VAPGDEASVAAGRGVKIVLATGLLGLVAGLGLLGVARRTPEMAPDFSVPDLRGQVFRLSAFRGRVVLVNLWTTWCAPCRQEMPSMELLYQKLKGRDFALLAVSQDEEGKRAVAPFVEEMKITFPVLVDPEHQVGDRYAVTGYPETFVIDRNGKVVEHVIGPRDWMAPEWLSKLEALIAASDVDASQASTPPGPS
jgi:peroxiredoxin